MRGIGLTAAAILLTAVPVAGQLTVRDVMTYSFAQGLVAAARAEVIAWVENDRGARNVWVAQGPAWSGRALTRYDLDDGQESAGLALTPDGAQVLYVRGGAPNPQGEAPDPISTPDVEGRSVWVVPTSGGEPHKVVDAGGFTLSPDGSRMAYGKGREIWVVALASGSEPRKVATIRGSAGSLTWSPDGTRLAFTSGRGDHAFVGVMDVSDGQLRYLDPGVARVLCREAVVAFRQGSQRHGLCLLTKGSRRQNRQEDGRNKPQNTHRPPPRAPRAI